MNARRTFATALEAELPPGSTVHPAPTNSASAPCWIIEPDVPYITPGTYCSAVRRIRLLAVVARTDAEANMDAIDEAADLTVAAVLKLEAQGLIMFGQMTAGSWIYIGTQGIVQGTYETFAAVAEKRFGGTLAGTLTLTGGCGGMGGAQPLAVTLNEGVCLIVDVDRSRLQRRVDHRYIDEIADDLDQAV